MLNKLTPDYWAPLLLKTLSRWLNVGDPLADTQFAAHFFSHATFSFVGLSISYTWGVLIALITGPVYAVVKEIFIDGHYKEAFSHKDARTDLLSRFCGGCFPFLTLLW